jgi:hypothetical protein
MPEHDLPAGRHRWNPLAEIQALVAKDATPATAGAEDVPVAPGPAPTDAAG